jgi:acyl carrier protein
MERSAMAHEVLEHELRVLIIDALVLEDMKPADLPRDELLFGEGIGLDSLDALEIVLALEEKYGITVAENDEETKKHFATIASLAQFVAQARTR